MFSIEQGIEALRRLVPDQQSMGFEQIVTQLLVIEEDERLYGALTADQKVQKWKLVRKLNELSMSLGVNFNDLCQSSVVRVVDGSVVKQSEGG